MSSVIRDPTASPAADLERLAAMMRGGRFLVLSGAGCSTGSGIPDYRDGDGAWKRKPPVQLADFLRSERVRRRYWARSLLGWDSIAAARPNPAHLALAELERQERVPFLLTQNVDGLHQAAGSRQVIDLHGRLDAVECLECGARVARGALQEELETRNPGWRALVAGVAPDGDADLEGVDFDAFRVPACQRCGGLLKPAVVFFGEQVPAERVARAFAWLETVDGLLVVGSSLMVWSGYRFVRAARAAGKPVAAINRGRTRADGELSLKLEGCCGALLTALAERTR